MGTIYPAQHRNVIVPRVELTWQQTVAAYIRGWGSANFAGIVGGETVTIQQNYGVPAIITMLAGDITAAAVAARINLTFPGLASVFNGGVLLTDLNQVAVTAISQADFLKIGLPIINRDVAAPASSALVVPIDPHPSEFNNLVASNYIDLPDNANTLGVWASAAGNDAQNDWGAQFVVMWSNLTEGEPPFAGVFGATDAEEDSIALPSTPDQFNARIDAYFASHLLVGAQNGLGIYRLFNFKVPSGATRARIFVQGAMSNGANPYSVTNPPPRIPPTFRCVLHGGAR